MAAETKAKVSRKALEQRRTSIETAIRKKRECEKKALEIVEYLVENKTTSSNWLIENSRYISPQYYDDVTEERAITKICGYPLCSNPLTTVQNKKFTISTKTNKVYDITERKKFCCDKCFSSSKHFKGQLPTSPLWMREEERLPIVEIPATLKSVPGDEVLITSIELPDDNKEEEMVFERQEEKAKKEKREREPQGGGCGLRPHPCDVIFKSLRRWFCAKTLDWLENTEDLTSDEKVEEVTERMADLKVIKASEEESPAVYKRASSYGTLERDEKNAELKVRAFLSGRLEYADEGEEEKEKENEERNEVDPDAVEVPIVMPLANLSAQRALRRKVILDYLEKWLIGFSASNSLKLHQYQQDLHSLVLTFNFTADTITFRPDEVPILSAAILLILGKKNPEIRNAMLEPHLQERFSKILSPFASSLQDLEEFLEDLVESCKNISM